MNRGIEFRERINPSTASVSLRSEVNGQADRLTANQRKDIGLAFERAAARATTGRNDESDRLQGINIFNVGVNEYVLFYQQKYHKAASQEIDRQMKTIETINVGEELAGRMRIEKGTNGLEAVLYDVAILEEAVV